ncbi:MAG: proton-conducting transporter membrane subunit [Gammaproteobacteria bacterium]|jgi:formate hydrogenlyase subunit 3/multisubunit Na+/H+ antiporter MnhD subunit
MSLMPALVLIPLLAAFIAFVLPRYARLTGMLAAFTLVGLSLSLASRIDATGPLSMSVAGWNPPLGIGLYADGLTALMLCLTAIVGLGTSLHAIGYFKVDRNHSSYNTSSFGWWPLWLSLWAALNALFLTDDIFNLYVTLELMGLAAVALVALEAHAVAAATRYLLVGLLGSMFYLLGVGLLYALHGTVDMKLLTTTMQAEPAAWLAMALMTAGLLLKTALFPLHFWLPPAHANAPAPVSAVLSALVVKAAFYALMRLWLGPFETLAPDLAGQLMGVLGAGAIIWGSLQALMAPRLKLVVAYSTVAQVGYLFLWFPLASSTDAGSIAWYGVVWLALSHGLAKAGLFLAAGNILHASGHDRVTDLAGVGQHLPITLFAVGLSCASIMGLPPSGGFVGKWLLLNAAFVSGQWWWAVVLLVGGVMAAAYSFRVLLHAFRNKQSKHPRHTPHPVMEWSALALAIGAILLGVLSAQPFELLEVGASAGKLALPEAPQ